MEQSDIISRLADIVDSTVARGTQSVHLPHHSIEARCLAIIDNVRATILPRLIHISNDEEDAVTLSVSNGRIASMSETAIDGVQSSTSDTTAEHIAQVLAMICSGSGLKLNSTPPENTDDVAATGISPREIQDAFDALELFQETVAPSVDTDIQEVDTDIPAPAALRERTGVAASFHSVASKITDQRILIDHEDAAIAGSDGLLMQNLDAVGQLMDDLATWDTENGRDAASPQLVILRSRAEEAPSLTLCRDIDATAMVVHHTRKLGAVVQMWKSLT